MSIFAKVLDLLFSTQPGKRRARKVLVLGGGLAVWLVIAVVAHPPTLTPLFVRGLGEFLISAVSFPFKAGGLSSVLTDALEVAFYGWFLAGQVIQALLSANVFRHIIVLFLPFVIAYRLAVIYLDDIFELGDERTAHRFIHQSAFAGRPSKLVVENGGIAPRYLDSPVHAVGGPGDVQVNLENLAVFDRTGGQPHLIGPTINQPRLAVPLEPFERLRDVIDLRDQITRANDLSVEGRTRDGIRIQVRDVRILFSVLRQQNFLSSKPGTPIYTYQESAILTLVYDRPAGPWTEAMISLVREQLHDFIAQHTLSEILAAIGLPEIEEQRTALTEIGATAQMLAASGSGSAQTIPIEITQAPNFVPRLEVTDLFYSSLQGFPTRASQRGVQLQWIDVGTWSMPNRVIPEIQVEAWRMSTENQARRAALEDLREESRVEELQRLVRDVPLIVFQQALEENTGGRDACAAAISAYLGVLRTAKDEYFRLEQEVPARIDYAILSLSQYLQEYYKNSGQARYIEGS